MDWDADPELRQLRDEFVASFADRRTRIAHARATLASGAGREVLREECHRLAGAGESYGFEFLSRLAGAVEDLIMLGGPAAAELEGYAGLLDGALGLSLATRRDPVALEGDARWLALSARVTPLLLGADRP